MMSGARQPHRSLQCSQLNRAHRRRFACAALGAVTIINSCRSELSSRGADTGAASAEAPARQRASSTSFDTTNWTKPDTAAIPRDSLGASIRRGLALMQHTTDSLPKFAPGKMNCMNCHLDAGRDWNAAPLVGAHVRYPKYLGRTGAVVGMPDRVNYCFTRSLAGTRLPADSREMVDIMAFLAWLSRDIPVGAVVPGSDGLLRMTERLTGDTTRGAAIYQQTCIACHGADGEGGPAIPPLWGPRSYAIGASMAREERAASFIWHNMPLGTEKSLTPQQAFDVAAYINSKPRPDSPGKERDWPAGGAPPDVPYKTAGREAYRPPARLVPRANPGGAVVPVPPSVLRARKPAEGTR
jgi:thiosulfate dehydrogenase